MSKKKERDSSLKSKKGIKSFIKSNAKVIIAFILGGIVFGGGAYGATILFASNDVGYVNTKGITLNGVAVDNVQDAIDALYEKANSMECKKGYVKQNATSNSYQCKKPIAAEIIGAIETLETTPYGKVYTGSDPDNYVWFNNEQWRIIGVYTDATNGDMLKIIKATPYTTSQVYNSSENSNAWSGSSMQTYLYNNYNSIISDATSRGMIYENGKWNVGAAANRANASDVYNSAIGTPWTGKIGLIASYEYQYGATSDCWSTSGYDYDGGCSAKDWLHKTITNNKSSHAWTLSPSSDSSDSALRVYRSDGYVNRDYVTDSNAASPVVYLKPTVTITGGNGKSGSTNSYKLG